MNDEVTAKSGTMSFTINTGRTFWPRRCTFCAQSTECVEIGYAPVFGMMVQVNACRVCSKQIEANLKKNWDQTGLPLHQAEETRG